MPRSSANTPAPSGKSHVNGSGRYVWVNDWYLPEPFENFNTSKLKGWHKVAANRENHSGLNVSSKDIVDLKSMKYYEEVPILSHEMAIGGQANSSQVENGEKMENEDRQIQQLDSQQVKEDPVKPELDTPKPVVTPKVPTEPINEAVNESNESNEANQQSNEVNEPKDPTNEPTNEIVDAPAEPIDENSMELEKPDATAAAPDSNTLSGIS